MGTRPLTADEAALWARVMAGVRPLRAVPSPPVGPKILPGQTVARTDAPIDPPTSTPVKRAATAPPHPASAAPPPRSTPSPKARAPQNTLDGTWDRQLGKGLVSPDRAIDLHGHTLHSAHNLLDAALDQSISAGDRVVLLVTGKPPRPTSERPHARGAIRAAIGDWLAGSRHAGSIAAVRPAHPRHGGAGALYIVLRRVRDHRNS